MKTLAVEEATEPLSAYVRDVRNEPVVLTMRGRQVAVLLDVRDVDTESLALAHNPRFVAIIERSRASLRAKGGTPLAEVRRELGLPPTASKRSRKRVAAKASRRATAKA